MVFRNLFSSLLSYLKPSLQCQEGRGKLSMGRISDGYSFALSNGIKPVPLTLANNLIHSRLQTGRQRLISLQEELERAKADLQFAQILHQRQRQISRVAENRIFHVKLLLITGNRKEIKELTEKMEHWKGLANQSEEKIFAVGKDVLTLTNAALKSAKDVETLRAERDETRDQLAREKERTEETEILYNETVSSISQSSAHEKELLNSEVGDLEETVRNKNRKVAELTGFREECKQEMEEKDRQIALHEGSELMVAVSRAMSTVLSEMSEVVPLGQMDQQNLAEKMQTLHDGMRDLVGEVKIRREHSQRLNLRIYLTEQERREWQEEFHRSFSTFM